MSAPRSLACAGLYALACLPAALSTAQASVPLTEATPTHSQNFDTLAQSGTSNPWTDNSTLPGWYAARSVAVPPVIYLAGTGTGTTGGLWSFGANPVIGDRALGGIGSNAAGDILWAVVLENTGSTPITELAVSFVGEQWRNGGNTDAQTVGFTYSLDATTITSGTWTGVASLDFTSPITGATAGALDGNNAANRISLSETLPITINPGETVWLRWLRPNSPGNDHGLAIDDFSVTATFAVDPTFAATGTPGIDDSLGGNGNGLIEPGESIRLTFALQNVGGADASSVSGTLSSLTPTASVTTGVGSFGPIDSGDTASNALPFEISVSPMHTTGDPILLTLTVTSVPTATSGASIIDYALSTGLPPPDLFGPPTNYYATATGTGAVLRGQLQAITSQRYLDSSQSFVGSPHRILTYGDIRFANALTDQDPNNPANVLLIYNRDSVSGVWDGGSTWNREHVWPQSRGVYPIALALTNSRGPNEPAVSDLHALRPCDPTINSTRNNSGFGPVTGSGTHGYQTAGLYYPGDADAGDVARTLFYMDVRYNGTDPGTQDLLLINGNPPEPPADIPQMGDLQSLLRYHYTDPPDTFERRRNHVVFSNIFNPSYYQGNRNPFVDNPEWVWTIFGASPNNSRLYVGGVEPANGASSLTVDFGRIMVAAALPPGQSVTLTKRGSHPTYFAVFSGGAATASLSGKFNAFIDGEPLTRTINVALQTSTATPGLKTGLVTIDNLDPTSSGTGRGSADGDDLIDLRLAVLENRTLAVTTGTVDLGQVIVGQPTGPFGFTVSGGPQNDDEATRVSLTAGAATDPAGVSYNLPATVLFNDASLTAAGTLNGTFATPGVKSGSVNLAAQLLDSDPVTGDTLQPSLPVPYSATAFARANPSINNSMAPQTSVNLDLGTLTYNSHAGLFTSPNTLWNLENGSFFTAGLDLTGISSTGSSAIGTSLTSFSNLAPLASQSFNITVNTTSVGVHTRTYTLSVADHAGITGAAALPNLTLQVDVEVVPSGPFSAVASAQSERLHAMAVRSLPLDLINPSIEPRSGGPAEVLFSFASNVQATLATTTGITGGPGSAGAPSVSGTTARIPLSGLADRTSITVSISNLQDLSTGASGGASVSIRLLVGDLTADSHVGPMDLAQMLSRLADPVAPADLPAIRADLNADAALDAADVALLLGNYGYTLP